MTLHLTYMKQDFLFSYQQGFDFVMSLYQSGGWNAVDAAYRNPPVDTEQILHPEKYPSDQPVDVTLPDYTSILGAGWREATRNVMGEWYLRLILAYGVNPNARLDINTATAAAAGWGGDSYLLYLNDTTNQKAFVMDTCWDSAKDISEFWSALQGYGRDRWANPAQSTSRTIEWANSVDGFIRLVHTDKGVVWIMAPDKAIADKLQSILP